jgi:pimeloyl-ACP methyl ester carboxylesterase
MESIKIAAREIYNAYKNHPNLVVAGFSRGCLIAQYLASMLGKNCKALILAASPGVNSDLLESVDKYKTVPKILIDSNQDQVVGATRKIFGDVRSIREGIVADKQFSGSWSLNPVQGHMDLLYSLIPSQAMDNNTDFDVAVKTDTLWGGMTLHPGHELLSKHGNYALRQRWDGTNMNGRLTLNDRAGNNLMVLGVAAGSSPHRTVLTHEGGLHAYNAHGGHVFLHDFKEPGTFVVQDDGNVVYYRMGHHGESDHVLWARF